MQCFGHFWILRENEMDSSVIFAEEKCMKETNQIWRLKGDMFDISHMLQIQYNTQIDHCDLVCLSNDLLFYTNEVTQLPYFHL